MTRRRLLLVAATAVFLGLAALFFLRTRVGEARPVTRSAPPAVRPASVAQSIQPNSPLASVVSADSPIGDALNSSEGTIRRDLEILDELFVAFQTNFPRLGNPVGENAEITAALTGDNPAKFVFISLRHRAVNARGELCDRWGTPFRFHQVSGTQMEIRSAGPDRKFATADDTLFP